jgi:hypothetical protein
MNLVPHKYRNIICPWQTKKDILTQAKTADKIIAWIGKDPERIEEFLMEHVPDRVWEIK